MGSLTDNLLLEAYLYARQLALSPDFIQLLEDEINDRYIHTKSAVSELGMTKSG